MKKIALKYRWIKSLFKDGDEEAIKKYVENIRAEDAIMAIILEAEEKGMTEIAYIASKRLRLLHNRYRAVLVHEGSSTRVISEMEEEAFERKEKRIRRLDL